MLVRAQTGLTIALRNPFSFKSFSVSDRWRGEHHDKRLISNRVSKRLLMSVSCIISLVLSGCIDVNRPASLNLVASSNSINLGTVPVGKLASATLSLVNKNPITVNITQLSLTGQPFSVGNQSSLPVSIAAGGTYQLDINFNPETAGQAAGELTITSDPSTSGAMIISVSGVGAAAQPASNLSSITCTNGFITGSGTDACTVTISGVAPSTGFQVSLSSNNTAVAVPATLTVPANATSAQFTANVSSVLTSQIATMSASANGESEDFALQLNAYVPTLDVNATSLAFGNVPLNTPVTESVTLTSAGTAPVTISAASLTGKGFSVSGAAFPLTLNSGKATTLSVQFDPVFAGAANGQLTFSSNSNPNSTISISLGGTGEAPAVSAITCANGSMTGSGTDACTVTIGGAAPSGGFQVSLSSNSSAVKVQATVTVPANASNAKFTANVSSVLTSETATLSASANSALEDFALKLNPYLPSLTISATNLTFGNVPLNSQAMQSLTLTSAGAAPVTISAESLTGKGFSVSRSVFPLTLNPGEAATVNVQFDPTSAGAANGQLTVTSNANPSGTSLIGLGGTGVAPALSTITCTNGSMTGSGTDTCTVTLSAPAPAGGQSVSLSINNAAVALPSKVTVPANATSAHFMASVSAVLTATAVTLTASAGGESTTYVLKLNAYVPTLTFSATSLTFSNIAVNTTTMQSVIVKSAGTAPVTISAVSLTGTGFALSGTKLPVTLNPSETATLDVEFDPPAAGLASGRLTIVSNSSTDSAAVIYLSGDSLVAPVPANSVFTPPVANACQSNYDQFYEAEPGVYAYWALCEAGSPIQIYDYVGEFDLTTANQSWGSGVVTGGEAGPVPDGETAASVPTASFEVEDQGIPLNTNQGTVAAWINADATSTSVTAVFLEAVLGSSMGKSTVSIGVRSGTGICFNGNYVNAAGTAYTTQKCGYTANTWYRVAFTWFAGGLSLYVDGNSVATGSYTGALDNAVFDYRLFPGCCNTGRQMTLAKVSIANQAWRASQAMADFSPSFPTIPSGGVKVSTQILGEIHRDVLGYADLNEDISSATRTSALISGLKAGGFTALRYAGGRRVKPELENWQGDVSCTSTPGVTALPTADGLSTGNNIDTYLPGVAQPLGLDIDYIVNYGTNPTACDAGGDPIVNGADLVQYANQTKGYGIKYFEIGNELFSNTTETDFHPNPNTGVSYATYEPAFYSAMKGQDPAIKIGVPIGLKHYDVQSGFDFPVLAGASYDAAIWHNYPVRDPITDGDTLYQDRVASNMDRTRGSLLKLQTELLNNGKSADDIWITEWSNSNYLGEWSKQSMGAVAPLFAASQLAEYMQAGVQFATWWVQGKPDVCSTLNYDNDGESAYSWWECGDTSPVYAGPESGVGEVAVGLQPGGLTPTARAFQILSQSGFVTDGEHMVRTQADVQNAPWLLSYAATHGPSYAVILINRDRDSAHIVPVALAGMTSGSSVQQWSYGRAQYDESRQGNWTPGPVQSTTGPWSGEFQANLPPWSVNVFVFVQ